MRVPSCGVTLSPTVFYAIQYCIQNTKRASRALVYSNLQRETQISGLLVPLWKKPVYSKMKEKKSVGERDLSP